MGKEKSKKRRRSIKSGESDSSSSTDVAREQRRLKKLKKKLEKERKKAAKDIKKHLKRAKKKMKKEHRSRSSSVAREHPSKKEVTPQSAALTADDNADLSADIPIELMEKSKAMAPMTKEEWEKRQSIVRRVYDEESGRYRLIKGDGEVLEEIVSKDRHKAINRSATQADGAFFQSQTVAKHL